MINTGKNLSAKLINFFFILLLLSCTNRNHKYYYGYFSDSKNDPDYYIVKDISGDGYRKEVDYYFKKDGTLKSKYLNKFVVYRDHLMKVETVNNDSVSKLYLTILTQDCIDYRYDDESLNDFAATRLCYIGKENVLIGKKEWTAFKYKKRIGTVESIAYLDKDFVLLKEEFTAGERPYYRIERLDSTLNINLNQKTAP